MFQTDGQYCAFPRSPYNAAELPAEYHAAVLERLERAAYRDLMREALEPNKSRDRLKTAHQRRGIRERAQEAASEAYVKWLSLRCEEWLAAGEHERAVNATIRYMRRSGWKGLKGMRRAQNRKATDGHLKWLDRRKAALQDRPDAVAMAKERIGASPMLARKAYRLAERSGIPGGVPALLQEATLAECSGRGQYRPQPTPTTGLPAAEGDRHGEPGSGFYRQGERKAYVMSLAWFDGFCHRHGIE